MTPFSVSIYFTKGGGWNVQHDNAGLVVAIGCGVLFFLKVHLLTKAEEKLLTNWLRLREQTTKTNHRPPVSEKEWDFVYPDTNHHFTTLFWYDLYQPSLYQPVHWVTKIILYY